MNILQRLNAVKKAIGYIQKDKKVDTYMAVTHDQVAALTRQHFIDNGILIIPSEASSETVTTTMLTGKGTPYIRFEAKYHVMFCNEEDANDNIVVHLTAHALDTGDKAPGKAISYATKYAILKVLQLETGEGDESRVEPVTAKITEAQAKKWEAQIGLVKDKDELKLLWSLIVSQCQEIGDVETANAMKKIVVAKKFGDQDAK